MSEGHGTKVPDRSARYDENNKASEDKGNADQGPPHDQNIQHQGGPDVPNPKHSARSADPPHPFDDIDKTTMREKWTPEKIAHYKAELDRGDPRGKLMLGVKEGTLNAIPHAPLKREDYPETSDADFDELARREEAKWKQKNRLLDIAEALVLIEQYDDQERKWEEAIARKVEAQHPH